MNHILFCDPSPSLLALPPAFWTPSLPVCSPELLLEEQAELTSPLVLAPFLSARETLGRNVTKQRTELQESSFFLLDTDYSVGGLEPSLKLVGIEPFSPGKG